MYDKDNRTKDVITFVTSTAYLLNSLKSLIVVVSLVFGVGELSNISREIDKLEDLQREYVVSQKYSTQQVPRPMQVQEASSPQQPYSQKTHLYPAQK